MAEFNAGTIKSTADIDITPFNKGLDKIEKRGKQFDGTTYKARADVDIDPAERSLRKLEGRLKKLSNASAKVDLSTGPAMAQLEALEDKLSQLDGRTFAVQAKVESAAAKAELDTLGRKVDQLDGETASIDATANTAMAAMQLQALSALADGVEHKDPTITARADTSMAVSQLNALSALSAGLDARDPTINVRADTMGAAAQLATLEARVRELEARDPTVNVRADTAAAQAQIAALEARLRSLTQSRSINVRPGQMAQAIGIIGLIAAGLASLPGLAAAAAAALAMIPAALAGAAQGIGALTAGLSGIGGAYTAMGAADTASAGASSGAGKQREAAARQVASAQKGLAQAYQQAGRQQVQSAWAIADAEKAVADARRQAAQAIADAERAVADARRNAARAIEDADRAVERSARSLKTAQDNLTAAWVKGRQELEDLQYSLEGTGLSQERAAIRLARAQQAYEKGIANGASGLDAMELNLDVREADLALRQTGTQYERLQAQAEEYSRTGVAGTQAVKSAQDQLTAAQESYGDAVRSRQRAEEDGARSIQQAEEQLARAREDGARQVQAAEEQLSRARQQAAWAAEDSAAAIAAAQEQLAQALADQAAGSDAATGAANKLADAMAKLTPAGRSFVNFLYNEWRPAWKTVTDEVQSRMLPGVEAGMRKVIGIFPLLKTGLGETGQVIGDTALKLGILSETKPFRDDLQATLTSNNVAFRSLGDASVDITESFFTLTAAAGPVVERLAAAAARGADMVNAWLNGKQASGELTAYLQRGVDVMSRLVDIGIEVVKAAWDIGQSLQPLLPIMDALWPVVLDVARAFGEGIGAAAKYLGPVLIPLIELIGLLARGFAGLPDWVQAAVGAFILFRSPAVLGGLASILKIASLGLIDLGKSAGKAGTDVDGAKTKVGGLKSFIGGLGPMMIALSIVDAVTGGTFSGAVSALIDQINHAFTGEALSPATQQWEAWNNRMSNKVREAMGLAKLYTDDGVQRLTTSITDGAGRMVPAIDQVRQAIASGTIKIPPEVAAQGTQAIERFIGALAAQDPAVRASAAGIARATNEALIPPMAQTGQQAANELIGNINATIVGRGPDLKVHGDAIRFGLTAPLANLGLDGQNAGGAATAGLGAGLAPAPGVAGAAGAGAASGFGAGITPLAPGAAAAGGTATSDLLAGLAGAPPGAQGAGAGAAGGFAGGIAPMPGDAGAAGRNATGELDRGLSGAAPAAGQAGRSTMQSLLDALGNGWNQLVGWLSIKAAEFRNWMASFVPTFGAGGFAMASGGIIGLAQGGVVGQRPVEAMASGGQRMAGHSLSPMSNKTAKVVQPNTWRVIGDNLTDPEAFIPINDSARSHAILQQTAAAMDEVVIPREALALAAGGTVAPGVALAPGVKTTDGATSTGGTTRGNTPLAPPGNDVAPPPSGSGHADGLELSGREAGRFDRLVEQLLTSAQRGEVPVLDQKTVDKLTAATQGGGSDGASAEELRQLRLQLTEVMNRVLDLTGAVAEKPTVTVYPSERMDEEQIGRVAADKSTFYAGVMG